MMDPGVSPSTSEVVQQKSISHAPDLLDGPDIEEEGMHARTFLFAHSAILPKYIYLNV